MAIEVRRIREVIVVEGRYDKNTVAQAVGAMIIETSGFRVLSDRDKIALIRRLAERRGVILLTDSDRAGFLIRSKLRGMLDGANVKNAYVPDLKGKERRKQSPSREGKLGVEGMPPAVIVAALERAGATFEDEAAGVGISMRNTQQISKTDLYDAGLSGGVNSAKKRRVLLRRLDLPERLTANGLLDVLNVLHTREEFLDMMGTNPVAIYFNP